MTTAPSSSRILPEDPSATNWRYTTRTFRALGYSFAVRSTVEELGRLFDRLYEPCAVRGEEPEAWYSIESPEMGGSQLQVSVDGHRLFSSVQTSPLVRRISWDVNYQVIQRSSDFVLLHAAAASRDGVGVLLPAASEAGKTTLVAGLVRSGFAYLTDEAAGIDPATLLIQAYPKPLTIDPGSWEVLADLAPTEPELARGFHRGQWHVSPLSLRSNVVSEPVLGRILVFPRYVQGAQVRCEPLSRSTALVELMRHTFRFEEARQRNIEVLARVIGAARCYSLVGGDLAAACAAIHDLVETSISGEGKSKNDPS